MKISLKEEVYNILLNSKVAINGQQIKDKLTVHINTKRYAIDQCILKLSRMEGCNINEITLECAYYQMTSTAEYASYVVLSGPDLVIRIMADRCYYMFVDEIYKQAVAMGYKLAKQRFRATIYKVSLYNECEIDSVVDDETGLLKYKMTHAPVRPYTEGNAGRKANAKVKKVSVVVIEDEPHQVSAVNLLFCGMAKDAAIQNRRMITDWRR